MVFDVVLRTMALFFLILAVGFVAGKVGVIKRDFLPEFARLITKVLLPCLIFHATVTGCTRQAMAENLPMIGLAATFYAVVSLVMLLLVKLMRLPAEQGHVFMFCFMFCFIFGNTGFIGIPLLSTVFPGTGLLYMALFSIVDTLVFWTFGIWLATPRSRRGAPFEMSDTKGGSVHSFRNMAKNAVRALLTPNIVAIVLAFAFVLTEAPLPSLIGDVLDTVSSATSAMCMIYLGALLCFSNLTEVLKRREVYAGIALKMVALPCAIALILSQAPLPADMVTAITLIAALPTMTIVPMIVAQRGPHGDYAAGITATTLEFSLITIPLVAFLAL